MATESTCRHAPRGAVRPRDTLAGPYAARAEELISRTAAARPNGAASPPPPRFLYAALAEAHTPLAYDAAFDRASPRAGDGRVFGNALAEADATVGRIADAIDAAGQWCRVLL